MTMSKRTRTALLLLVVLLATAAAVLAALGTFFTEYLWFEHLGFGSVFVTVLLARVGTGAAFGLFALLVLGLHILFIGRFSSPREDWTVATSDGESIDLKEVVRRISTPVVIAAAITAAAALGYWASLHWEEVLKLFNRTPFGRTEPILGEDIGFYLFALPALQFAQQWLVFLTGLGLVMSAVVYFLRDAVIVKGRSLEMSPTVRGHLLVAFSCVLLVVAWGWRLEMFELLFSKRGVAYGATYTDVHANLVAYPIMIAACIAAALVLLYLVARPPGGKKDTWIPVAALGGVVVLYLLTAFVWPTAVQQLVVRPNELEKETPYLEHAIRGTRAAYGLDRVESRDFSADAALTARDLERNRGTIDNIKLWDHRPLLTTYRQIQAIRLYYDFPSISVDRYRVGGRPRQVMLSPRELVAGQLPAQAKTWVNRHLQYTHGHGLCLSPVNRVVEQGLPELWVKDIPPRSRHPGLEVTRPEIYYGLATTDYALVKTTTREFDFPEGTANRYATYQGEGGVGVGSFFRRLLFAVRMADVNLLFTRYLAKESRVLFNRTVQERVAAVAPFLMLDPEPYLVLAGGRLFWIQDAYTISYRYPYSQPTSLGKRRRINYIRNSVKVVVDAYHGRARLYIWDAKDPMVRTYARMFPDLFLPAEAMPGDLRAHVRYPKELFTIQAAMYESFHMTDPQVFYTQEDKWSVARELAGKRETGEQGPAAPGGTLQPGQMQPHYMVMRLPGETREEFLLMVPYTPVGKENMVAWMAARCDGESHGNLLVYSFPKKKLVFGPMQIEARIDQNENISKWITLRGHMGSRVIRGELLVIPVEDSIMYVEPIYLRATQTQVPELKQVIVAHGKRLAMRDDLSSALRAVFPEKKLQPPVGTSPGHGVSEPALVAAGDSSPLDLVRRAAGHHEAAYRSLARIDWAGYGKEQTALRRTLEALSRRLDEFPASHDQPAPPPSQEDGGEAGASDDRAIRHQGRR